MAELTCSGGTIFNQPKAPDSANSVDISDYLKYGSVIGFCHYPVFLLHTTAYQCVSRSLASLAELDQFLLSANHSSIVILSVEKYNVLAENHLEHRIIFRHYNFNKE